MKLLVACEYSGIVRSAFQNKGWDAWSCDLLDTEIPGNHIVNDVTQLLNYNWDMLIAHPPCTYLCSSGARWWKEKINEQIYSIEFVQKLLFSGIKYIAIENPIGILSKSIGKPSQIIQPWQFGHGETKAICLWLKNLPKLQTTNPVEGRENRIWKMSPGPNRGKERSRFYTGIAEAMADQWTEFIKNQI